MEIKSSYLFYGDADLSSKEDKLLSALKITLGEVEIGQERVKVNLEKLNDCRKLQKKEARNKFFKENDSIFEELMTDIHLWLIAWSNAHKILNRLQGIQNDNRLKKILDKNKNWFLEIRKARNSLEHLDERVLGSPKWYFDHSDLGFSFMNNSYGIFGLEIKFNTLTFKKLERVIKDIDIWYSNLPSVFGRADLI